VLAQGGADPGVQQKLAPLLARRGQGEAALAAFHAAADGHLAAGFVDRAVAVYAQATHWFPTTYGLWERIAELHLSVGRKADAVRAFLDARGRLRGAAQRPQAILCLSRALEIEPGQPDAMLDLARLCAKDGQPERADELLDELAAKGSPALRRRIAWVRFRLAPSPATLWRWLFPA